jgi:hypothetical protein
VHHGVRSLYDRATTWTGRQEMMPYGLNGAWHYPDCTATTNFDPECDCVGNMAQQLAIVVEECGRLMQVNRTLESQLRRASNG